MTPTRPKRRQSRRSSILKPPKQRIPLQAVNFDGSSADSSPTTTKLKRRVSFAEKKHIKEFCDSWDNTYEEHDLSSAKLSASHKSQQLICSPEKAGQECGSHSNCDTNADPKHVQNSSLQSDTVLNKSDNAECKDVSAADSDLELTNPIETFDAVVTADSQMMRLSPPNSSGSTTNACTSKNITVYEDLNELKSISNTSILCQSKSNSKFEKNVALNKTCAQNTSMEFTEAISTLRHLNNHTVEDDKENNFNLQLATTESDTVLHDASMEITEVISTITKNHGGTNTEGNKTVVFHNTSMDFTSAISYNTNVCNNRKIQEDISDKTTCFYNASMEMTKAVTTALGRNLETSEEKYHYGTADKIPHSIDLHYEVSDSTSKCNGTEKVCLSEKTNMLHLSMEITEVLPAAVVECTDNQTSKSDQTTIYSDKQMEFTKPISTILQSDENRIQNFSEMKNTPQHNSRGKSFNEVPLTDRTNMYQNEPVIYSKETTIPTIIIADNEENTENNPHEDLSEGTVYLDKTKLFQNVSMEVTNVISSLPHLSTANVCEVDVTNCLHQHTSKEPDIQNDNPVSDTNVSMEITSVVPSLHKLDDNCTVEFVAKESESNSMTKLLAEESCASAFKETGPEQRLSAHFVTSRGTDFTSQELPFAVPAELSNTHLSNGEESSLTGRTQDTVTNEEKTQQLCMPFKSIETNMENSEDMSSPTEEPATLTEHCRASMSMSICEDVQDESRMNNEYSGEIANQENISAQINRTCSTDSNVNMDELNRSVHSEETEFSSPQFVEPVNNAEESHAINKSIEHTPNKKLRRDTEQSHEAEILNPFCSLARKLKVHSERSDCIWNMYHENAAKNLLVIGFINNSLLVAIFLLNKENDATKHIIKEVKLVSCLADDADTVVHMVHRLLLEKINRKDLTHSHRNDEDIEPMLDYISQEVKLVMDFAFDLRRLSNLNLMDISHDRISFISRTKQLEIILKVTINIKAFDTITPDDVTVYCLLGTVRTEDVKQLIVNVKKDCGFLRRYMKDVNDYIELMEESLLVTKQT